MYQAASLDCCVATVLMVLERVLFISLESNLQVKVIYDQANWAFRSTEFCSTLPAAVLSVLHAVCPCLGDLGVEVQPLAQPKHHKHCEKCQGKGGSCHYAENCSCSLGRLGVPGVGHVMILENYETGFTNVDLLMRSRVTHSRLQNVSHC